MVPFENGSAYLPPLVRADGCSTKRDAASSIDLAESLLKVGDTENVAELLNFAMPLAGTDRRQVGRILALQVTLHHFNAEYDAAAQSARKAMVLFQELGDVRAQASLKSKVARLLLAVGNTTEASSEALVAIEMAQQIEDRTAQLPVLVECFRAMAYVYVSLEQYDKVITFCERGAEYARIVGDVISEGVLVDCVGCAYGALAYQATAKGQHELASDLVARAITNSHAAMLLARSGGHYRFEATALANAAEGLVQNGDPEQAKELMKQWPAERSTSRTLTSHRLDIEGLIRLALGQTTEAIESFGAALRAASDSTLALVACEHLADACERAGDYIAALSHQKRVLALYKKVASEAAQQSASVAAVHFETRETLARLEEHRAIVSGLQTSNENLNRRADDLLRLSRYDPLTGLANRRLMDEMIEKDPLGFGIVMIDVDHFKAINDGWSHIIGDAVLRNIAMLIGRCCRDSDVAVRYGGDEFAILVTCEDEPELAAVANRVKVAVEVFEWATIANGLVVSVSIGCSKSSSDGIAIALADADRRLYRAKRAGRNRVVTDETMG